MAGQRSDPGARPRRGRTASSTGRAGAPSTRRPPIYHSSGKPLILGPTGTPLATAKPAANTSSGTLIAVLVLLVVAYLFISNAGQSSSSNGGGGSGQNFSDTVQGQYCSDPENGAVAQGIANGNGASYYSVCAKMWAVDKYLNAPIPSFDPFAP